MKKLAFSLVLGLSLCASAYAGCMDVYGEKMGSSKKNKDLKEKCAACAVLVMPVIAPILVSTTTEGIANNFVYKDMYEVLKDVNNDSESSNVYDFIDAVNSEGEEFYSDDEIVSTLKELDATNEFCQEDDLYTYSDVVESVIDNLR